jgi:hypothetical protein
VPLSLAWLDDRVVVAADAGSRTARNVTARGGAQLALGPTRDVVMIDAVLERVLPTTDAGPLAEGYARQADWESPCVRLTPLRGLFSLRNAAAFTHGHRRPTRTR